MSDGVNPPIPFGFCSDCCAFLTIEETIYIGRCAGCEEDRRLDSKRSWLYEKLGLIIEAKEQT